MSSEAVVTEGRFGMGRLNGSDAELGLSSMSNPAVAAERSPTSPKLNSPDVKFGFTTRVIPMTEMADVVPMTRAPRIGDLVLAEVLSIGKNKTIEVRSGVAMYLFPGDKVVGAFGHRYATDQYEGYVPEKPVKECYLLSVGSVFGKVVPRHTAIDALMRLGVPGLAGDRDGRSTRRASARDIEEFYDPVFAYDPHEAYDPLPKCGLPDEALNFSPCHAGSNPAQEAMSEMPSQPGYLLVNQQRLAARAGRSEEDSCAAT